MSSSDQHPDGGDLSSMAASGTSIPSNAGQQNLIPSVPRPDQMTENSAFDSGMGAEDLQGAADNAADMPRSTKDIGQTSETVTGTGDQMPVQAETKRMHLGANDPLSKGHDRYDKHSRQKESDLERYAGDGAGVQAAPGEEEEDQDTLRDRKGL